jgi:tetratricopeptide (TPR) repeat protein
MLGALVAAAAFVLAVTRVEDPDTWTHLALGRLMVETRALPAHEVLVFPSGGLPYHNTEWLFDIVLYLVFRAGGLAGVVLLKAATVALAFWVLFKDATLPREPSSDRTLRAVIAAAVLLGCLPMVRHRFIERPDIALMVFLAFTIYALNAYLLEGRRLIFALPAVHLLWANMHPSVVVTVVPFGAVLAGGGLLLLLRRGRAGEEPGTSPETPNIRQLKVVAGVLVADVLVSLVNPRGIEILTLPFQLAASPWFTQEINELQRPSFGLYPGPYMLAVLLLLSFLALRRRSSLISALMVLPFAYLGLSAVRFIFVFAIVGAPVLARNVAAIAVACSGARGRRPAMTLAAAALAVCAVSVGLALAQVPPLADSRKTVGLGADARFVPEGALRYLDGIGMTGRLFNAFHFGGYITWRDFPKRAAIIDGRGYVPGSLREEIHFARAYPEHLARLQAAYGFDAAVLDYPVYAGEGIESLGPDADWGLTSPGWALVYWDDFALVYLRRSSRWEPIIARDEYRRLHPANGLPAFWRSLADKAAAPEIKAELERNVSQTNSARGRTLLGFALLQEGKADAALEAFGSVRDPERRLDVLQGQALAWQQKGDKARGVETYERAVAVQEDALTLYGLGAALIDAGRAKDAIRPLERAREKNPELLPVYALLIDAYRRTGDSQREGEVAQAGAAAVKRAQATERARNGLGLNSGGRVPEAVAELEAASALDPDNAKIRSDLGFVYLYAGRTDDAVRLQRAALERNPRLAQAHYGLGLALEKSGDRPGGHRELAEYARLEPRSYLAWRLREAWSAPRP